MTNLDWHEPGLTRCSKPSQCQIAWLGLTFSFLSEEQMDCVEGLPTEQEHIFTCHAPKLEALRFCDCNNSVEVSAVDHNIYIPCQHGVRRIRSLDVNQDGETSTALKWDVRRRQWVRNLLKDSHEFEQAFLEHKIDDLPFLGNFLEKLLKTHSDASVPGLVAAPLRPVKHRADFDFFTLDAVDHNEGRASNHQLA